MRVAVASSNPVKLRSVELGLAPLGSVELVARPVPSGVPDQPIGEDETRLGAVNRAAAAFGTDVDYAVGIEGGVVKTDAGYDTFAIIVIHGASGVVGTARTAFYPLPPRVCTMIDSGYELGPALDELFGTTDIKRKAGAIGLLTRGAVSRTDIYVPAVTFAALPLIRPELYEH